MSKRRHLRDSAARRRAEQRAKRRAVPDPRRRVLVLTGGVFVAGMLIGSALGIVLDRRELLPEPVSQLADRAGARSLDVEEHPGQKDGKAAMPSLETEALTDAAESKLKAPKAAPMQASPEPVQAHISREPPVEPEVAGAIDQSTADRNVAELSVPEVPVSSEALDAASAISLEPPAVPGTERATGARQAMDRGPNAEESADLSARPRSPPVPHASEPPAGQVHVVYEEAQATRPVAAATEAPVNLAALVEQARARAEPALPGPPDGRPTWQANAVSVGDPGGRPMIAMVFDDLGLNRPNTRRVIALSGPLTLSFLTYAEDLEAMTGSARAAGHELMVHVPMEPMDASLDPGRNVLLTGLDQDEIHRRLTWGLDRFSDYVGINNHMGSRFTSQAAGMAVVLAELKRRGLLFLDSRTAVNSVGASLAGRIGVPFIGRDIFIDNDPKDPESIRRQLDRLETVARRRGAAIGIGHPHGATIEILSPWLAGLQARGFALVPISTLVRRRIRLAEEGDSAG